MRAIEIYGQPECVYCRRAVEFCEARGLDYVYRDIREYDARAEMMRRNPQAATVPQIFIGEKLIGGHAELVAHNSEQLQQMIGGA